MRVLVVAPSPPPMGGMAIQAQNLVRLLQQDGIEAELFASNFALPALLRVLERVPVVRTAARIALIGFFLAPKIRRADVVHVLAASWLYFFAVVYPAVLLGTVYRKRVVLNYRGGAADLFFRRYGWLAWPVFKMSSRLTTPSRFLAELIQRRFGVPVSIVPNVLDLTAFKYRRRAVFRPRLLVTRQLEKIYDVASVLRAFREVQQCRGDASLWIAGSGSEEPALRELSSAWELRNVRFLGNVPHDELPAVYAECDVYVNASLVDNFPGSLLEASAAGLVVVTTAAGGIPFLYADGLTACLVEPGDWRGLARRIEEVFESPAQATKLTEAAAEMVRGCAWVHVRTVLFEAYGFDAPAISTPAVPMEGTKCAAG